MRRLKTLGAVHTHTHTHTHHTFRKCVASFAMPIRQSQICKTEC